MMKKELIEDFLDLYLEGNTFEDLLEHFNVTPLEAFETLFDSGLIDEELFKDISRTSEITDGE